MLLGTELHEGAHALAIVLLGGRVTHMVVLPTVTAEGMFFGYTDSEGVPPGLGWVVALGPFVMAHLHVTAGALLSAGVRGFTGRLLFFTSVLLPMVDISMLYSGLLLGSEVADLAPFAGEKRLILAVGAPLFAGLWALAWRAFRRNWAGAEGLPFGTFSALLFAALAAPSLRFLLRLTA